MKQILSILFTAIILCNVGQAQCKCGTTSTAYNWSPITVSLPLPIRTVKCGHQFKICAGDSIALRAKFNCMGGCNAYYKTVLKRNGIVVATEAFESAEIFYMRRLRLPGRYELTFNPVCGNNLCRPCVFYITVNSCR